MEFKVREDMSGHAVVLETEDFTVYIERHSDAEKALERVFFLQGQIQSQITKQVYDLEALYRLYPRKMGKPLGMKRLHTLIKTPKLYERMKTAITNYAVYCMRNKIEERYMMLFQTFVNDRWKEFENDSHNGAQQQTSMRLSDDEIGRRLTP